MAMGGKNRQRKSSFFSVFNIFKSNNKQRGGSYSNNYEEGSRPGYTKVWPSDEDKGRCGVADPVIDMRATAFIAHEYKKRISESEIHCQAQSQH